MSTRKNIFRMCFAAALAAGLTACGGGGTKVVNTAPSLTLGGTAAIDEGDTGTTGLTVTATDAQDNDITLTVSDPRFGVVGGVLTVVAGTVLDYEKESSITVSITADDGELSDTMSTTVSVNNVDDNDPTLQIYGTRGSIVEGETGGTGLVFEVDDNDGMMDSLTFTATDGFSVLHLGGGRYELQVDTALDREAIDGGTVSVTVTATDGSGSAMTPTLTIAVGGKDDTAPMLNPMGADAGTIDENGEGDTGITFRPTDADGDALFSFFLGGTDRKNFAVVPAGYQTYALQVSDAFDYEKSGGTVSVTVTVVDSSGMHDEATFEVTVKDVNDVAPTVKTTGMAAINEEMTGSTGLMVAVDDEDTVGGTVTWTPSDPRFTVTNGMLVLTQKIDYDGDDGESSVTVNLTANDGANDSMQKAVMVTINAVNDNTPVIAVTGTAMAKAEGTFAAADDRSTGVTVSVTDGDGDMVTPTVSGDARFAIDDATGNLVIAAGSTFDYETAADKSIMLTIMANDGDNDAMSQSVTVMFTNVNDSDPMLTVKDLQAGTRQPQREGVVSASTQVGYRIMVDDADTDADNPPPMLMVTDPSGRDRFEIDAQGYLTIKAGSEFDFEGEGSSIALVITANDGRDDAEDSHTITFNIANVDERPVITGEANPTLVMGPRGDGQKNVTTLKAVDPDNPNKSLPSVEWDVRTNPTTTVWTWTENSAGDELSLGMAAGTFLGDGGPAAGSYTGYTADDAKTLARHVVDADDAELDAREVVRPKQIVDTITTSPALSMAGTYMVSPSKMHVDETTGTEKNDGKPGKQSLIPTFDDLTDDDVVYPTGTKKATRLLTDGEIHVGIISDDSLGGTKYAKRAARATVGNSALDVSSTNDETATSNIATWYDTDGVGPSVPMEPAGLDIVTETRAANISTGAIAKGQELAIRYRFTKDTNSATAGNQTEHNVDVALIDGSGMVREEYRKRETSEGAADGAHNSGNLGTTALDASIRPATGTDTRQPLDVNVTNQGSGEGTLDYARYGLWSYNNTRACSTACPENGLRGATAFGLKAKAADVNIQTHIGIWGGGAVAFWGQKGSNGGLSASGDGSALAITRQVGTAEIAVDFTSGKVQANMNMSNWYSFDFHGKLDADKLGYTAMVDTRPGSSKTGRITGEGALTALAEDQQDNVHATGTLNGAFYGPPDPLDAQPSTTGAAMAPTETAGTWQIIDDPTGARNETIVVGTFGADLNTNTQGVTTVSRENFPYINPAP